MIYVMTSKYFDSMFKVGKTTNTDIKALLKRYRTALCHPILMYWRVVPDCDSEERRVLDILDVYRIQNDNGNPSEWVSCSLAIILDVITINDAEIIPYSGSCTSTKLGLRGDVIQFAKDNIEFCNHGRLLEDDIMIELYGDDVCESSVRKARIKAIEDGMSTVFGARRRRSNNTRYFLGYRFKRAGEPLA